MATQTEPRPKARDPLTRERVLRAAVDLADREGIQALTMRNLARELGAEAMSLYYHVDNKEAVLDGVVEVIMDEINKAVGLVEGPPATEDWKSSDAQEDPRRQGGIDPPPMGLSGDRDPHDDQSVDDALLRRLARGAAHRRLLI